MGVSQHYRYHFGFGFPLFWETSRFVKVWDLVTTSLQQKTGIPIKECQSWGKGSAHTPPWVYLTTEVFRRAFPATRASASSLTLNLQPVRYIAVNLRVEGLGLKVSLNPKAHGKRDYKC